MRLARTDRSRAVRRRDLTGRSPGDLDGALELPMLRYSVAALCLSITEV
jgi:hypothetical protein